MKLKPWVSAFRSAFAGKFRWLSIAGVAAPAAYATLSQWVPALPRLSPWLGLVLSMAVVALVFLMRLVRLEAQQEPKLSIARASIVQAKMGPPFRVLNPKFVAAEYVHVELDALGVTNIPNCSLYLLRIRKSRAGEVLETHDFRPPVRLITATDHDVSATCFHGVPLAFDLVAARADQQQFDFAPDIVLPHELRPAFFSDAGTYEFELRATSDVPPSVGATVAVEWNGRWDGMTASIGKGS